MDSAYILDNALIDIVDNEWRNEKFVLIDTESEFNQLDAKFPAELNQSNRKIADQMFEDAVTKITEILKDFTVVDSKKALEDLIGNTNKTVTTDAPRRRSDSLL